MLPFFRILKILNSILQINFINFISKILRKKNYFFFHPKENLTLIHTYYIEDIFLPDKNYTIFYGHKLDKNLGANYFFIKESYLKFIFFVDIFISNNVCDQFTVNSKRIYIHHNIYDSPLVDLKKEKKLCERLFKYHFIFLPNEKSIQNIKKMLKTYKINDTIKIPKLSNVGYAKLDYLEKKIHTMKSSKDSILIAPTNFYGFPNLTMINDLQKIIGYLLDNTKSNIILRPHPSNRFDEKILKLKENFLANKNFFLDKSENYLETYSRSKILITDLSATAYTYSFLTYCPVIFYSNEKIKNHHIDLNYFKNRKKIGLVINETSELIESINFLEKNSRKFMDSIKEIKKEIVYIGESRNKIHEEINKILN